MKQIPFIRWFDEVSIEDIPLVGGKNASLGEMIRNLQGRDIKVPNGFALTTEAYEKFLRDNDTTDPIREFLGELDPDDLSSLKDASSKIREVIKNGVFHEQDVKELHDHYQKLKNDRKDFRVAVRSSASAEDLPNASFAGQQDTYLHVSSFDEMLNRIKDVYSSLFTERAIAYRAHHGFDHRAVLISVGIQEMVNSDEGASGVMFTIDPESGFKDCVFINSSFGLGEMVVSGAVNPDEFMVYKPAITENRLVFLNKRLGTKERKLIFSPSNERSVEEISVQRSVACHFSLTDADVLGLCRMALSIEEHYDRAMDIEWAKDGDSGEIYVLQARPETVHSQRGDDKKSYSFSLDEEGLLLCKGRSVGKRIGQGRARILVSIEQALDFVPGEVLVTDMTDPNWEPVMQKASAIVTDRGGRTCHAAIIARELGIPAVVGCGDATRKIKNLNDVTVSCANGDEGQIFSGLLKISTHVQEHSDKKSPVPLMLIAANPQRALSYGALPHQGIGLARIEFIIAHSIGVHPNAILKLKEMPEQIRSKIEERALGFSSPEDFYVETLAQGMATLAAVASPHPVIVRLSDFKTNEYEELLGGNLFEHKESNPMLGFRGAARYVSESFKDAFMMECLAIKRARQDFGFKNIELMVPFVRTLDEAERVVAELKKNGLMRGSDGIRFIMMCEVPSNVVLAHSFLEYFDGFSIGSNDLTQLTLGVDRDSHLVAGQFKESDPAVLKMLKMAIAACKDRQKYVGICGQGPSDDIELARWLIKMGIDSISLAPDTIADTHEMLTK